MTGASNNEIAIIGVSGRFPGASSIDEHWDNIINGECVISKFTNSELIKQLEFDQNRSNDPNFMPYKGYLQHAENFAAGFFGYSAKAAILTDPQIRIFLESVLDAWNDAGYDPYSYSGSVGVYATASSRDSYYEKLILNSSKYNNSNYQYEVLMRNARDFLATTTSYHFNFNGPSINIQTACSSSLVAIDRAYKDLAANVCETAIVGGVSVTFPLKDGYLHKNGMIYSKDGKCCPFSTLASGIVPGDGCGVVILKSLAAARRDNDQIYGIIIGSAINNDGRDKLSFTAPSVDGQLDVLNAAYRSAGIEPTALTYIEAHGTGTQLGDQIEIAALKELLCGSKKSRDIAYYLGSIKANIGHLDVAAGIMGLIKCALMLKNKTIPREVYSETTNFDLGFSSDEFILSERNYTWNDNINHPVYMGVSSFGVGGTNAHVVLQEYKKSSTTLTAPDKRIFLFSAKTIHELDEMRDNLAEYVNKNTDVPLDNIAYTLCRKNHNFKFRTGFFADSHSELLDCLYLPMSNLVYTSEVKKGKSKIAFIFSELSVQNSDVFQYVYSNVDEFAKKTDLCFLKLKEQQGLDIADLMFSHKLSESADSCHIDIMSFLQQYSLAYYLKYAGVCPDVLLGIGLGEYVAACFSQAISCFDAIKLVVKRRRLLDVSSRSSKAVIFEPLSVLEKFIETSEVKVVAVETQNRIVISAPNELMKRLIPDLQHDKINVKLMEDDAFIVDMVSLDEFQHLLNEVEYLEPRFPIFSTVNTDYVNSSNELQKFFLDGLYKAQDIFSTSKNLLVNDFSIFLDLSVKGTLSSLVQQANYQTYKKPINIFPGKDFSVRDSFQDKITFNLISLWCLGVDIMWHKVVSSPLCSGEVISLPSYPFNRQPYFITSQPPDKQHSIEEIDNNIDKYIYSEYWARRLSLKSKPDFPKTFILASEKECVVEKFKNCISEYDSSSRFSTLLLSELDSDVNDVWISRRTDIWLEYLNSCTLNGHVCIIYICQRSEKSTSSSLVSFYDLIALAKAIGKLKALMQLELYVITNKAVKVNENDIVEPYNAMTLSPVLCIPLEYQSVKARLIDIDDDVENLYLKIIQEIQTDETRPLIAYRNNLRYARYYKSINSSELANSSTSITLKAGGVYLITGGLGGIGLALADYLVDNYDASLVLISRTELPESKQWHKLVASNDINSSLKEKLIKLLKIKEKANKLFVFHEDVSSYHAMSEIVSKVEKVAGRIFGVIHSAGILPRGLIQEKSFNAFNEGFRAKLNGLQVLNRIFSNKDLDFLLLCSSLSAVRGSIGTVDYVAANIYLDAYANYYKEKLSYPVLSLGWDGWKEVGMRFDYLNRDPAKNPSESTNAFTTASLELDFYKSFIDEHRFNGKALLPGALLLEIFVEKYLELASEKLSLVIDELYFLKLAFVEDIDASFRFVLYKGSDRLLIEKYEQRSWTPLAEARNISVNIVNDYNTIFLDEVGYLEESIENKYKQIATGPHWNCLQWIKRRDEVFLAKLMLPSEYINEVNDYTLHPSLFDVAISYFLRCVDSQYVPFCMRGIKIFSCLPATFYSKIEPNNINGSGDIYTVRVHLIDEKGVSLVVIDEVIFKKIH